MKSSIKRDNALLTSASALVKKTERHEAAVVELQGITIDSEDSLQRARQALQICAECEESLAEQLTALVGAMNDLQQRQQHCLAATLAAANHIRHKASERNSLLEGIARLGAAARSITQPIADSKSFGDRIATTADAFGWLEDVSLLIDSLIGEAQTIGIAAENTTWLDIASESATLTSQLQAARNDIVLMQRTVSPRQLS